MMLRWLVVVALVAAVAAQNPFFNSRQRQRLNRRRQQQRQQQQQEVSAGNTDVRIGLVREQLGNLDPVPGSDYPSRIVNNNNNQQQQQIVNTGQQGVFRPNYQLAGQSPQQQGGGNNQNLQQQPGNAIVGGGGPGRTSPPAQQECSCTLVGECPHDEGFDGAGLLDIRIVNTRPTVINNQLQCSGPNQKLCCPPGHSSGGLIQSGCPRPAQPGQCGRRTLLAVAGYNKQPAEAQFGAYPWVATVLRAGDQYVCSGVLISDQWVLTVAHHVNKYRNNYSSLKIRFGEWDASDPNHEPCRHEERYVAELRVHPGFNQNNLQNDVALLRLQQPLDLSAAPHINPACLPFGGQSFDYNRCWVAGFGKDAFGTQGQYSFIQKEVDVPVVPYNDCQAALRRTRLGSDFYLDGRSFVCAGGEAGKDSCEGDGGAPLACETGAGQWTVAGLVAWGVGCAQPDVPGVYVNVASFADWISSNTGARTG